MINLDELFRYSPDGDGGTPLEGTVPPVVTPPVEKTFTQKELDDIIVSRLAKESAKHQKKTEELFKKLGVEDESKIEDVVTRIKEYDTYKTKAEQLEAEITKNARFNELRRLNVDDDFLEFALSKVDGETPEEFVENAKKFLETNPKILKDNFRTVSSGLPLDGEGNVDISKMSTEQYLAWRRQNKL